MLKELKNWRFDIYQPKISGTERHKKCETKYIKDGRAPR